VEVDNPLIYCSGHLDFEPVTQKHEIQLNKQQVSVNKNQLQLSTSSITLRNVGLKVNNEKAE
jgi:hypothetical protein